MGLGGAGGIAAHVLTEAGLDVVALEAGPRLDPTQVVFDELGNERRQRLSEPKSLGEGPTWRPDERTPAVPAPWATMMVNALGGSTLHYAGLSMRFLPWNFESRRRVTDRYGASALPHGSSVADWPVTYEELEPHYDAVEYAIGVSGSAGDNRFEGPRAREYPMRPLRRSGWNDLTADAARSLGWHPFAAPAALNSEPYNGNPECTYCGFCDGNCCYRNAKGSTDASVIPRAEATGNLRVEVAARVVRIEVDGDGLVCGVTYVKDGRERFQAGCSVLLGAFTYENTRLLLLSTSKAYPRGLSNNHGRVGADFTVHVIPRVFGVFPGRRLNAFSGPWTQATCVDDWNADNFDHAEVGFVGGGMLAASGELKPIATAIGPPPPGVPAWGSDWKRWLKEHGQSVAYASGQFDSLTYDSNRLDLDPAARDPYGRPVVRITLGLGENERRGAAFLRDRLAEWLLAAGASETWSAEDYIVEARHCYGGTRMGDAPESSVVDRFGFSHEAPNLGVIGASVFPTAGGHNPTLTLQALTWRTAQHLVENWAARARDRADSAPGPRPDRD